MIAEAHCSDIVQLSGLRKMDEIAPFARVFCSLQSEENYPSQALLEAIASGCYCIATNVGNTSAIVKPQFGCLVDLDVKQLSEALFDCISFDASRWDYIEASAKQFALDNFSIEKASSHYQAIIDKLVMN